MLSGNSRKGLSLFLSLLVASAVSAAPTVSDYNRDAVAPALSLSADIDSTQAYEINQIGEPSNSHLASVAAEFLKPPTDTNLQAFHTHAKSLPPVPGALFLGLVGFLCVSLVKDRRVWLAAVAGLLWLGQTGFAALPQLASHLLSKKQIQQQSSANLIYISELEGSFRLRSDLEGTQYIGLLRHLAGIPGAAMLLSLPATSPLLRVPHDGIAGRSNLISSLFCRSASAQNEYKLRPPQFAIAPPALHLIQTNCCSVPKTEQPVPFSPAFIFSRLARGPPELASYVIPAQAGIQ